VYGVGCRVWGMGCRVWGVGCGVWGVGSGVRGTVGEGEEVVEPHVPLLWGFVVQLSGLMFQDAAVERSGGDSLSPLRGDSNFRQARVFIMLTHPNEILGGDNLRRRLKTNNVCRPLSSELGTHKTVTARFWPGRSG